MDLEFAGGSLKLKAPIDKSKKKKKKKSKDLEKSVKQAVSIKPDINDKAQAIIEASEGQATKSEAVPKNLYKTKAEIAFERAIEKRMEQRILKKAELSHKDRVEIYNKKLDELTEYNDIPKVSWTK